MLWFRSMLILGLELILVASAHQVHTPIKSIVPPSLQLECHLEVDPPNPHVNQLFQIQISARNIGNIDISKIWAQIWISDSAGNPVQYINLTPFQGLLAPLHQIGFQSQTSLDSPGDYLVKLNLSYDSRFCIHQRDLRIIPGIIPKATPAPISIPAFPLARIEIPVPRAEKLELIQHPLLIELYRGEAWVGEFRVYNPASSLELNLEARGIEEGILEFPSPKLELAHGESLVELRIRADLLPGDYLGVISLKGSKALAQFPLMLRVISQPSQFPFPSRHIFLDWRNGTTQVILWIKNGPRFSSSIKILEQIPKQLASNASQLKFHPVPEIIQPDPVVSWELLDFAPYEKRWVSYTAPKILETMAQYVYWPIKQVTSITHQLPPKLSLANITIPTLAPGESGIITIELINKDHSAHDYLLRLELPWNVSLIKGSIPGSSRMLIQAPLQIPDTAQEGSYSLNAILRYDDQEQMSIIGFSILRPISPLSYIIVALIGSAPGIGAAMIFRRQLGKLARSSMLTILKRMR